MRTTIDVPDELYRELKVVAAERGTTLKRIVREALERELQREKRPRRRRLRFPLLDSVEPGSLNLTNAEIDELLA